MISNDKYVVFRSDLETYAIGRNDKLKPSTKSKLFYNFDEARMEFLKKYGGMNK